VINTEAIRQLLWIDDDQGMLLLTQKENLIDAGYEVKIEPDVDKVIKKLNNNTANYYGIIIDLMMNSGSVLREKDHRGGMYTGLILVKYLFDGGVIPTDRVIILTHCLDQYCVDQARELKIKCYSKQDYMGTKIVDLIGEAFEVDEK
jgi:ActR/RegA family two-component response regulator